MTLSREWNLFVGQDSAIVADSDQYILHYVGPDKPWSQRKPDHWQVWSWYAGRLQKRARMAGTHKPSGRPVVGAS